jgi:Effector Associated Constant Component 1
VPTKVVIRLDAEEEIRRLARWLRDEDELRGRVALANAPIQQGEMGGAVEAVLVTLAVGTGPVFVRSLFDWLARRKSADKVALTVESANGHKLSLECGSSVDAEKLLKALAG